MLNLLNWAIPSATPAANAQRRVGACKNRQKT